MRLKRRRFGIWRRLLSAGVQHHSWRGGRSLIDCRQQTVARSPDENVRQNAQPCRWKTQRYEERRSEEYAGDTALDTDEWYSWAAHWIEDSSLRCTPLNWDERLAHASVPLWDKPAEFAAAIECGTRKNNKSPALRAAGSSHGPSFTGRSGISQAKQLGPRAFHSDGHVPCPVEITTLWTRGCRWPPQETRLFVLDDHSRVLTFLTNSPQLPALSLPALCLSWSLHWTFSTTLALAFTQALYPARSLATAAGNGDDDGGGGGDLSHRRGRRGDGEVATTVVLVAVTAMAVAVAATEGVMVAVAMLTMTMAAMPAESAAMEAVLPRRATIQSAREAAPPVRRAAGRRPETAPSPLAHVNYTNLTLHSATLGFCNGGKKATSDENTAQKSEHISKQQWLKNAMILPITRSFVIDHKKWLSIRKVKIKQR